MALKDIWSHTNNWLRNHKLISPLHIQPELDEDGLIRQNDDTAAGENAEQAGRLQNNQVIVKAVPQNDKQVGLARVQPETLEKLQEGFDKLIERLQGINEHLEHQATQHEELMNRIQQLPKLMESFPALVENQKKITEQLFEQLKASSAKNEQFVDAVEQIPTQTAKQTDALINIDHQLAAAADIDVQMSQSLNNFNQALDKLKESTVKHTEGIEQMSKTFAASDRYLKYIISKQNQRFMWVFIAAISICSAAILILTGIIIYLRH
jgi:predicted ribosome quality control (RQC) complex YloA/Tae2 family protein